MLLTRIVGLSTRRPYVSSIFADLQATSPSASLSGVMLGGNSLTTPPRIELRGESNTVDKTISQFRSSQRVRPRDRMATLLTTPASQTLESHPVGRNVNMIVNGEMSAAGKPPAWRATSNMQSSHSILSSASAHKIGLVIPRATRVVSNNPNTYELELPDGQLPRIAVSFHMHLIIHRSATHFPELPFAPPRVPSVADAWHNSWVARTRAIITYAMRTAMFCAFEYDAVVPSVDCRPSLYRRRIKELVALFCQVHWWSWRFWWRLRCWGMFYTRGSCHGAERFA